MATQLAIQLAEPAPYDLDRVELVRYRALVARWQDWSEVERVSGLIADDVMLAGHPGPEEGEGP